MALVAVLSSFQVVDLGRKMVTLMGWGPKRSQQAGTVDSLQQGEIFKGYLWIRGLAAKCMK